MLHDVKKMLEMATKLEESNAHDYNVWANECSKMQIRYLKVYSNLSLLTKSVILTNLMMEWLIQTMSASYDPLMSSIEGGEGVFGSASTVKEKFFLYKNQP
jgi:hypothetical protein